MAGEHFRMLQALFRPWYIKAASALATLFAAIGVYADLQDQFPDALPKLQDVVIVARFLILPWWGWLLVLHAVLFVGLFEYVRRNLPPVSARAEAPQLELPGTLPQASINDIATNLRTDIAQVNNRLIARVTESERNWTEWKDELCKRIDLSTAFTAKQHTVAMEGVAHIQNQIAIDFPNASTVAEAFQNLDQAVQAKTNRLDEDIQRLRKQFRATELDLIGLFHFAVDSVTIRFLNRIIDESPLRHVKSIVQYDDPKERARDCSLLEKYVSDVLGWVGHDTDRGIIAAQIVKDAENEMENTLLHSSPHGRPHGIDPYVFRKFAIADLKCRHLVGFLKAQRDEVAGRITAQRSNLIGRMQLREKAYSGKASQTQEIG